MSLFLCAEIWGQREVPWGSKFGQVSTTWKHSKPWMMPLDFDWPVHLFFGFNFFLLDIDKWESLSILILVAIYNLSHFIALLVSGKFIPKQLTIVAFRVVNSSGDLLPCWDILKSHRLHLFDLKVFHIWNDFLLKSHSLLQTFSSPVRWHLEWTQFDSWLFIPWLEYMLGSCIFQNKSEFRLLDAFVRLCHFRFYRRQRLYVTELVHSN